MNKIYLTFIVGLFLIGTVYAGGLIAEEIGEITRLPVVRTFNVSLAEDSIRILNTTDNIVEIKVIDNNITCDERFCKSWVVQEGLIHSEWIVENKNQTARELEQLRKEYTEQRLNLYAEAQAERNPTLVRSINITRVIEPTLEELME